MVWNAEDETKVLLSLIDKMANILDGTELGNPYEFRSKLVWDILHALNRARNDGFEAGRKFEREAK